MLAVIGSLGLAVPASAHSWTAIEKTMKEVEATGTEIVIRDCSVDRPRVYGYYRFNQAAGIDRLVICNNETPMSNPTMVWETLSHEATHVAQACMGETLFKPEFIPEMEAELRVRRPEYLALIKEYPAAVRLDELEAFWMELQPVEVINQTLRHFCHAN